jgi:type I restriction enzyme S subunit
VNSKPLLDIGDKEWHIVEAILQRYVPNREVWAFGSRAKWTAKEFSDLDLAILGEKSLTLDESAALADAFADSDLPWKVDVVDWVTTSPSFRKIIERDKVILQLSEKVYISKRPTSFVWPTKRLGDCCEKIGSGATPKGGKDSYLEVGPFHLIRSQNIHNDGFSPSGLAFISEDQAQKLNNVIVESGDVLLNITGDSVARVCQAVNKFLPARVNQHVAIIRPKSSEFDARYLRYFLASPMQQDYMLGLAAVGATRNALTKGMIESFQVPCPPLPAQQRIADVLASFDERITLLRETNITLEAIAQALFKSWFVDFDPVHSKMQGRVPDGMDEATTALFPDSFEESELGTVPKGWTVGRLDDLLVLQRGFDLPAQDRAPGDFPIVAASGPSGTHHKGMVKGPGVITGRSGVLGRVFFELEDFWPLNTTLWIKEFKAATPCYAYEVLRLIDFKSFNAGSAVPSLNRNHIHGLPYLLPERGCVEAFEDIALQIHKRCLENKKQARTLEDVRDALLPRLISGQLSLEDKG